MLQNFTIRLEQTQYSQLVPDDFMSISAANGIENCKLCVVFIFIDTKKKNVGTGLIDDGNS